MCDHTAFGDRKEYFRKKVKKAVVLNCNSHKSPSRSHGGLDGVSHGGPDGVSHGVYSAGPVYVLWDLCMFGGVPASVHRILAPAQDV